MLDVGAGGGFPTIPLAIMCRSWLITAIDGTGKKVRFVADAAGGLGFVSRHARAADMFCDGEKHRPAGWSAC
ncbi:MAG: RsmG family class I SAM-dependent methyltransferase [Planctomycetota bacterium]